MRLRCLLASLLILLAPLCAQADDQVSLKTADKAIAGVLSDVPCVALTDAASTELRVEQTQGIYRVIDSEGAAYSASSIAEAVDGYLRLKGICVIKEVTIKGYSRISPDAIRFRIKTAKGDIIHKDAIKKDIEEIYSMGYFEKCDASHDKGSVTFQVKEYPVIMSIEVKGNKEIKEKEILDAIGLKKFDILNTRMLKTSIDRIKGMYRDKGYYKVDVTSSTKDTEGGITLTFDIKENEQLYIRGVSFDGNEHISSRKLNGAIETKTRWWFGIFGHEGSYQDTKLDNDLLRIEQYYADNGYIQAKVGRPRVEIKDNEGIYITFPVSEGPLFTIGSLDITGELIEPKDKLMSKLDLKSGDIMSKSKIRQAIENLRNVYMDKGFAYVQVRPDTIEEGENKAGLDFKISKGNPVTIDTIQIRGNTKTRDKVIRRELKIQEGDLFSSTSIKKSQDALQRLGYFKSVNIESIPKDPNTMSLLTDVEETTTGAFSFGVAYSTQDGVMGTIGLSESNIMGRGLKSKLSIEYGSSTKNYSLDFEEPWLLDYPVSLGAGIYNTEREYLYYTKHSRGGSIRLSYPFVEEWRHYIAYSYDDVAQLKDIDPNYRSSLTQDEINGGVTSSITNTLYRDTTNDYFRPTRGSNLSASIEYAGIGGDFHFIRTTTSAAKFFPLYSDKVALMLKGRWGTIVAQQGDLIPDYERFQLGGLNTIRGFKNGEVGPQDSLGNFIGGRRMVIFNSEITFPLGPVPGLYGVVFHDEGNSYDRTIDLSNLKKSYGGGIRWVTPMGPLRLEYARVIHPEEHEDNARWEFSIGTFF
jgi:outer membrane protein insertion porin family